MLDLRLISRAFGTPLALQSRAAQVLFATATACGGEEDATRAKKRAWLAAAREVMPQVEAGAEAIRSEMASWDGKVKSGRNGAGMYVLAGSGRDIALVDITGVLDQTEADVQDSSGNRFGTAFDTLDAIFTTLETDTEAKAVMLVVNSPGGLALPCAGALASIQRLAAIKPVYAYGLGLCCSAALYLAIGAQKLWLGESTIIGSIGTTMYHVDQTEALRKAGLSVEQFSSAVGKTLGASHRPLGEADRAALQSEVDALGAQFVAAVATARKVSQEKVVAWGARRELIGAEAVAQGLADGLHATLRDAVDAVDAELGGRGSGSNSMKISRNGGAAARAQVPSRVAAKGKDRMKLEDLMAMEGGPALAESLRNEGRTAAAGSPASVAQLKAEFGTDTDFILACVEKNLSMGEAKAARAGVLALKLEATAKAHAEEVAKLNGELDAATKKLLSLAGAGVKPGVDPVAHVANGGEAGGDGDFMSKVAEVKAARKCGQEAATIEAAKLYPALAKRYRETGK